MCLSICGCDRDYFSEGVAIVSVLALVCAREWEWVCVGGSHLICYRIEDNTWKQVLEVGWEKVVAKWTFEAVS